MLNICAFSKSLIVKDSISGTSQLNALKLNWHLTKEKSENSPIGINAITPETLGLHGEVIIAVIDTGININSPNLQGQIWINKNEIPNNGLDDDSNGYIDDIVGWNFLGSKDGSTSYTIKNNKFIKAKKGKASKQVFNDTLEITRSLQKLIKLENFDFEYTELFDKIYKKRNRAKKLKEVYSRDITIFKSAAMALNMTTPLKKIRLEQLINIIPKDLQQEKAKALLQDFLLSNKDFEYLQNQQREFFIQENFHYNYELNQRENIVKDNSDDIHQKEYGNNNVATLNSDHGTKVSHLISAKPTEHKQIMGVGTNIIKIMALRAIPNGDERDKDIVNAIKYAVDNGAKVINMSFGKYSSPNSLEVTQALEYARRNEVIVVIAAGNDYTDITQKRSYPFPYIHNQKLDNSLIVGSSSPYLGVNIVSSFTNYGSPVDILAPGEKIYTLSSTGKIEATNGSSLAAPQVSAVAALVSLANPDLRVNQITELIKTNGTDLSRREIYLPNLGTVPIETVFSNPSILNMGKVFSNDIFHKRD
jgi:subtilisin family serine protease